MSAAAIPSSYAEIVVLLQRWIERRGTAFSDVGHAHLQLLNGTRTEKLILSVHCFLLHSVFDSLHCLHISRLLLVPTCLRAFPRSITWCDVTKMPGVLFESRGNHQGHFTKPTHDVHTLCTLWSLEVLARPTINITITLDYQMFILNKKCMYMTTILALFCICRLALAHFGRHFNKQRLDLCVQHVAHRPAHCRIHHTHLFDVHHSLVPIPTLLMLSDVFVRPPLVQQPRPLRAVFEAPPHAVTLRPQLQQGSVWGLQQAVCQRCTMHSWDMMAL